MPVTHVPFDIRYPNVRTKQDTKYQGALRATGNAQPSFAFPFNLSRWNDMHVENFFCPRLQHFLSFQELFKYYNPGKTNDKFVTLLMISIRWYRTDEFNGKRNRRIIVYGSVTRYGPQISCKGLTVYRVSKNHMFVHVFGSLFFNEMIFFYVYICKIKNIYIYIIKIKKILDYRLDYNLYNL